MTFPMFEDVIVTANQPAHNIRAGDVGIVVERHVIDGKEDGYSVEFFDRIGQTVAVLTLSSSQLRLPTNSDRLTVRASNHQ